MVTPSALIQDAWTALSHKGAMNGNAPSLAPSWVPRDDERRLTAYKILQAYLDNVARYYVSRTAQFDGDDPRDARREYGDAALLVDQALAALLGDEQTIVVDGADDVAELDPDTATPEETAAQLDAQAALDRQEWFRSWALEEMLWRKVPSTERKAIGLGDGLYSLDWDAKKRRVRLSTWNPGFYFPVIDPLASPDDYPEKIHIAYQYDDDAGQPWVRRITWRLGAISPQVDPLTGDPVLAADGGLMLQPGDTFDPERGIVRRYPWQAPDEEPSAVTCYKSDGVWELGDVTKPGLFSLSDAAASSWATNAEGVQVRNLDLMIDFIPAVHIPNTGDTEEHFGQSMLMHVAQIIDDIQSTDTDLQAASGTTGSPPLVIHSRPVGSESGPTSSSLMDRARGALGFTPKHLGTNDVITPGPGAKFDVGSAKAEYLDTSKSLDALLKLSESLLSRLAVNSRLPESVLGRTDINGQLAGITLALSFGPLRSLVRDMRSVRDEKYPVLTKFVQRMAMAGGELPAGEPLDARVQFGSFLPTDMQQLVLLVTGLLEKGAISRQTGLLMLVDGGLPIDDAAAELERIQHEDFKGADLLANVSVPAADRYLGIEDITTPPVIDLGVPPVQ